MRSFVSIIGAGNIASKYDEPSHNEILTHAHAIVSSDYLFLKGFFDINMNMSVEAARIWGGLVFSSIEDAISSSDIVCISTPERVHGEIIEKVLSYENVKAIIGEKPFTVSTDEAESVSLALKARGIPFLLNYSRRYMPEFQEMRDWIGKRAGRFLYGNCLYGKGTLHNASHFIDIIRFLLGDVELNSVGSCIFDYNAEDPSYSFALKSNDYGGEISFYPVDCSLVTVFEMDLLFERGRIKYSDENSSVEYYEVLDHSGIWGERNFVLTKTVNINPSSGMIGLYKNLEGVIQKEEVPMCSCEEGIFALKIVEEIRRMGRRK